MSFPFCSLASQDCPAALLALALAVGMAPAAAAQTTPDYSNFTLGQFIPFANAGSAPPKLHISIAGQSYTVTLDTGSTGVMLSASQLPASVRQVAAQGPAGWEFLSSSNRLWSGHWVVMDIQFLDAGKAAVATATVPVLAVEQETICPGYDRKSNPPTCPDVAPGPAPQGIAYMGVGFGREHDGQPQGTPDKNPLLNITRIDGVPVQAGKMRSGYVITAGGVHAGLTARNTEGFVYQPLIGPKYSSDHRDWPQASMCVLVDGSACAAGSVLVDTGIPQMYLTLPPGVLASDAKPAQTLANGSRVTVRFPADNAVAFYTFAVGDTANPLAPAITFLALGGPTAFVNTGHNFLRRFDVLFDADGGFFGLRWTGPPAAPEGGTLPRSNLRRGAGPGPGLGDAARRYEDFVRTQLGDLKAVP